MFLCGGGPGYIIIVIWLLTLSREATVTWDAKGMNTWWLSAVSLEGRTLGGMDNLLEECRLWKRRLPLRPANTQDSDKLHRGGPGPPAPVPTPCSSCRMLGPGLMVIGTDVKGHRGREQKKAFAELKSKCGFGLLI